VKVGSTARHRAPDDIGHPRNVAAYYDQAWLDYRLLWTGPHSRALHLGYRSPGVKGHIASLMNNNAVMAARVGISPGQVVLDAGCGVGGTALWMARRYGARVVGVTVSTAQAARAARYARSEGLEEQATFLVQDFTRFGFPAERFDVVYAMESVCHATDKRRFLDEAWRILKPGGRLILHDGFGAREPSSEEEAALVRSWLHSWAVPHIAGGDEFVEWARQTGFDEVTMEDHTSHIRQSVRRLYVMTVALAPFAAALHFLRIRSDVQHGNVVGARDCWRALDRGLWFYGVFMARKPEATPSPATGD
jgi:ubiquinone/menaquinone biosynthesis C-methylase UbiE